MTNPISYSSEHYNSMMSSPYAQLFNRAVNPVARMAGHGVAGAHGAVDGISAHLNTILAQAGGLEMLGTKAANGSKQARAFLTEQKEHFEKNLEGFKEVAEAKKTLLQTQRSINRDYSTLLTA